MGKDNVTTTRWTILTSENVGPDRWRPRTRPTPLTLWCCVIHLDRHPTLPLNKDVPPGAEWGGGNAVNKGQIPIPRENGSSREEFSSVIEKKVLFWHNWVKDLGNENSYQRALACLADRWEGVRSQSWLEGWTSLVLKRKSQKEEAGNLNQSHLYSAPKKEKHPKDLGFCFEAKMAAAA